MPGTNKPAAVVVKSDQRTRVGLERRQIMRKRLLAAVMSTYARRESTVQPNIDDIAREAKVSRQTFYLYFTSLEDAVSKLGQQFAEEMSFNMENFSKRNNGPLQRLAGGILIFSLRSVTDPLWGAFVSHTQHFSKDASLIEIVRRDLSQAKEMKLIQYDDLDAATDFYVGSVREAVRRLVNAGKHSRAYVEHFSVLVLLGLRVPYEDAKDVVQDRAILSVDSRRIVFRGGGIHGLPTEPATSLNINPYAAARPPRTSKPNHIPLCVCVTRQARSNFWLTICRRHVHYGLLSAPQRSGPPRRMPRNTQRRSELYK